MKKGAWCRLMPAVPASETSTTRARRSPAHGLEPAQRATVQVAMTMPPPRPALRPPSQAEPPYGHWPTHKAAPGHGANRWAAGRLGFPPAPPTASRWVCRLQPLAHRPRRAPPMRPAARAAQKTPHRPAGNATTADGGPTAGCVNGRGCWAWAGEEMDRGLSECPLAQ